jgi:hypothetical protein
VAMSESTFECTDCHNWYDKKSSFKGKNRGPDLTGYGSEQWTFEFIQNPAHARFYGSHNDRMPKYGDDKILTEKSIRLITRWLRGDWYEPGRPFEVVIKQPDDEAYEAEDQDSLPPATAPSVVPPASAPAAPAAPPAVIVPPATSPPAPATASGTAALKPSEKPAKPEKSELD